MSAKILIIENALKLLSKAMLQRFDNRLLVRVRLDIYTSCVTGCHKQVDITDNVGRF